jgi:hypothetical protein
MLMALDAKLQKLKVNLLQMFHKAETATKQFYDYIET